MSVEDGERGADHSPITESQSMDRVTVRMPDQLLESAEAAVERGEYPSRSEAIRDAVRQTFDASPAGVGPCRFCDAPIPDGKGYTEHLRQDCSNPPWEDQG